MILLLDKFKKLYPGYTPIRGSQYPPAINSSGQIFSVLGKNGNMIVNVAFNMNTDKVAWEATPTPIPLKSDDLQF